MDLEAYLQSLTPEKRLLLAQADVGQQVDEFIASDIGRVLIGFVEQERTLALTELARVSSWRRRRITHLQNQVWRCDAFETWLRSLVARGHNARQALQQQEAESYDN